MRAGQTFSGLAQRGEMALIPYLMAGFPSLEGSLELMAAASGAGADVLEIGIPFSDPVADGPSIQHAGQIALSQGFRLRRLLDALRDTPRACPTLLMSYLNPLLAFGRDALLAELRRADVCGLIVPDLPLEESETWLTAAARHDVTLVFLIAPTTADKRLAQIAERSREFVYAVSLTGTTGARAALDARLPAYLRRVKRITSRPVAVGFGIATPEHVRSLHGLADGVVVGSRLIEAIRAGEDPIPLISSLKEATRSKNPC